MKRIVLVFFFLFPGLAALAGAQGSIGDWQLLWTGSGTRFLGLEGLVRADDKAFFSTGVAWSHRLWVTDGTEQGTLPLAALGEPDFTADQEIRFWSTQGSRVFFTRAGYPGLHRECRPSARRRGRGRGRGRPGARSP